MTYTYRVKEEVPVGMLIKIEDDDDDCQILDIKPEIGAANRTVPVTDADLDRLRRPFNCRQSVKAGPSQEVRTNEPIENAFSFLHCRDPSAASKISSHLRSRSSSGPSTEPSRPESSSSSASAEAVVPPLQSTRELLAHLAQKMTPRDNKNRRDEMDERRKRNYSPYAGRNSRHDYSPRRVPVNTIWIPTEETQWTNANRNNDIADYSIYEKNLERQRRAERERLRERDGVMEAASSSYKDQRIRDNERNDVADDHTRSSKQGKRGARLATITGERKIYVLDESRSRAVAVSAPPAVPQEREPRHQQSAVVPHRNFHQERRDGAVRRDRPDYVPPKPRTKQFTSGSAARIARMNQDMMMAANPELEAEMRNKLDAEFEALKKDDPVFQAKRAELMMQNNLAQVECITLDD